MTTSEDMFGKKLGNWYHFHAIDDKKDIIIASIKDIPCNEDFLIWLEAAARLEAERKPHLIADQVAELIKLLQEYEEKDIHQLGNDSADFVLSCKGERDLTKRVTCAELLTHADKCSSARELLLDCIDDENLVKFIMKNSYFVKEFIIK